MQQIAGYVARDVPVRAAVGGHEDQIDAPGHHNLPNMPRYIVGFLIFLI